MPYFRGNQGNLMQHWMLCELLAIIGQNASQLSFIDAHAMAPLADTRYKEDYSSQLFDKVRTSLPGQNSQYEKAWKQLGAERYYPNSAAFLSEVWQGKSSLLLCEKDSITVDILRQRYAGYTEVEIAEGDWRDRFKQGLPQTPLMLFTFDPNMYDRHKPAKKSKSENMYPSDIKLILDTINDLYGEILIQISTYSANNDNAQDKVVASLDKLLEDGGLTRSAKISADGNMMSLIYTRDVVWVDELKSLSDKFDEWFGELKR